MKGNIPLLSHLSAKSTEDPEGLNYLKPFQFPGPRMNCKYSKILNPLLKFFSKS